MDAPRAMCTNRTDPSGKERRFRPRRHVAGSSDRRSIDDGRWRMGVAGRPSNDVNAQEAVVAFFPIEQRSTLL